MDFGEPTLTLGQTLWLLSPELVLLLAGLLILGLDAIRPRQEEKRWLPYAALAGLAGALGSSCSPATPSPSWSKWSRWWRWGS